VARNKISQFENGDLRGLTVPEIDRCFGSMGARLWLKVDWHGAELDRLLDEGHATLVAEMVRLLRDAGWRVEVEVSFSDYGDRGSIDLLAWHAPSRTVLVVEIKTEVASVEGLLRPLDVKGRLAARIARERFGWQAQTVSRLLVLPDERTQRRRVEKHATVFTNAFPTRTRQVKRWLRDPAGDLAGLLFLPIAQLVGTARNPSSVRRVRSANRAAPRA
jgi:hypothetical protein